MNGVFTIPISTPIRKVEVFLNGLRQTASTEATPGVAFDFNVTGNAVTFVTASIPRSGDSIVISYTV